MCALSTKFEACAHWHSSVSAPESFVIEELPAARMMEPVLMCCWNQSEPASWWISSVVPYRA